MFFCSIISLNKSMYIIECLPFSKGLNKESLSYFSSTKIEPGSLVKVPIRGREIQALVVTNKEAIDSKTEIKSANFQVKKVLSIQSKPFLKPEYLKAVKETASYFASNDGAILSSLIPTFVTENPNILSSLSQKLQSQTTSQSKSESLSLVGCEDEERFANYKSLIREEFAKGKTVFICLSQNENILQAKEKLERGIEHYVCAFYKDMSKKEFKDEWKKASTEKHPVVIIATARWLFIPRNDIGAIVIEKENDSGWKTLFKPFFDLRFFAEKLSSNLGSRLIYGDFCSRIETLYRYKEGELSAFENVKWRLNFDSEIDLIDMRAVQKKSGGEEFECISEDLGNLIEKSSKSGSHLFIYASRKGLSSTVVCKDCGEMVCCSNCDAPMVLHRKDRDQGIFRCHQCGEIRDAAEYCKHCGSWKLAGFGSGIDRIKEEIKKKFPDLQLFEINKEIAPTSTKASTIINKFYSSKSSVLLGTEIAFPYLQKRIQYSAIASLDSLFAIPDFRIHEKIFRIIIQTRNLAKKKFLIQSRNPEEYTIKSAIDGNIAQFYAKEVSDRQPLGYSPFGLFIKITFRGTKASVQKEAEKFKDIFSEYRASIFPSAQEKRGEQAAVNAVIKLKKEEWPEQSISTGGNFYGLPSLLSSLPPTYEIKIDPDTLL